MKVAIVHDYLREYGGAESVVEALHEIFPDAPVFTASYYPKGLGSHNDRIKTWDIRTSWFDKWHLPNRLVSPFRIFAPKMFESFNLSDYDVVISSSAIYFAKAVKTKPGTLHIAYIHTPPRYLYGYVTSYNYKKHWWTKIAGEIANHFLRIIDYQVSQRPDILVTNSKNVAARIKKFYRRDAIIIYPPVDLSSFPHPLSFPRRRESIKMDSGSSLSAVTNKSGYYLSLGRLVRGKGVETIVAACTSLNLSLKVAGSGPLLNELKKMAGSSIEFLGHVTDEQRAKLYSQAKAFIVASEDEDFGITQIEAMASGTPVIAIKAGGYAETIIEGKTGEFFEFAGPAADSRSPYNLQTVENLIQVLKNFDPKKYKEEDLRKNAEKFSKERFKKEILNLINSSLRGPTKQSL